MKGLASIIIPTYYRNEELTKAICSAKNQSYNSTEIIVVDDSGEEHAKPVAEKYDEIKYIPHDQNMGAPSARATGFKNSSGEYIQLLDDDDTIDPSKIEKQVKKLQESEAGVVYCGFKLGDEYWLPEHRGNVIQQALTFSLAPCSAHTMLAERGLYAAINPLDPYDCLHDIYLSIEFAQRTHFDYVDEILAKYDQPVYKPEAIKTFDKLIEDYSHLYEQQPDYILQKAKAVSSRKKGHAHLAHSRWSISAVKCYLDAFRYSPEHEVEYLLMSLFSLFGEPGRVYGMEAFRRLAASPDN